MEPDRAVYLDRAQTHDVIPVYRELIADLETPVSALQRFVRDENVFLFESVEGGETWGRYSFLGVDPEPLLTVDHTQEGTGPLDALREVYRGLRVATFPGLPRFTGGAVGFLAYEAAGVFEQLPRPKPDVAGEHPSSRFLRADRLIAFDNVRHTATLIVCTRPGEFADPAAAYDYGFRELNRLEERLRRPPDPVPFTDPGHAHFVSNMTPEAYRDSVRRAQTHIVRGDAIQIVLSQRFEARLAVEPFHVYRALRLLNPSPYLFFLKIGDLTLAGSSPEVMVRRSGNEVALRPIAGSRPRGATETEDRRMADELLSDEKERAEHLMLVDLGRNDLGRVSAPGTVKVTELLCIERYSHIMHLVSHVTGQLRRDADALDVIRATFPAGTLTGAPKIRAMEIIHDLEPGPRNVYGGAIGYLGYDGNMDLAITIRTVELRGNRVAVQAGAGVVFDSDPEREFQETGHKARGMIRAVEWAARGLDGTEIGP